MKPGSASSGGWCNGRRFLLALAALVLGFAMFNSSAWRARAAQPKRMKRRASAAVVRKNAAADGPASLIWVMLGDPH
jgi:hypothetical protein